MMLFTKDIDKKLFQQYELGSNLEKQKVIAKIFNPYSEGRWFLINSDPQDPNYLWAIVQMGDIVEVGSVSRKALETARVGRFRFPLERDLGFSPVNAAELFRGLNQGKFYGDGGETEVEEEQTVTRGFYEDEPYEYGYGGIISEIDKMIAKYENINTREAYEAVKNLRQKRNYFLAKELHEEDKLTGESEGERRAGMDNEYMAAGGDVKWQDARIGDSARVKSENKMGIIKKDYGRKFHLKFVDGTEKTYDASELEFIKDEDDYAKGGEITPYIVWVSKDGEKREFYGEYKSMRAANMKMDKLWESGEYKLIGNKPKSKYEKEGFYADGGYMADGGKLSNGKYKYEKGDEGMFQGDEVRVVKYNTGYGGTYDYNIIDEDGKVKTHGVAKAEKFENQFAYFPKMKMGGKVTFEDKVSSIKESLLKRKKVSPKVQKDYGKTYNKKEALESAQRIAGAMRAKYKK